MTADTAAMSHFGQTTHLNNANVKISSTSGQLMKQFKAKEAYFSLSGSTFYFRGTSYKNKEGMINVETGALEFL
jgi:hypothetical protein